MIAQHKNYAAVNHWLFNKQTTSELYHILLPGFSNRIVVINPNSSSCSQLDNDQARGIVHYFQE